MIVNCLSSHERNVAAVVQKAKESLDKETLESSGTILYSSSATLKPGKYYFLGLNPGGADDGTKTIQESLENLTDFSENAYLEENWSSASRQYGKGGHPLQQNYQFLFSELREALDSVCASNLIFRRSVSEKGARYEELVDRCWRVHEAILEIVRPKAIITFGRQPFNFIKRTRCGDDRQDRPAGHGKWIWRSSTLATGERLVGLPHLSRYALRSNKAVVDEIKNFLGLV